MPRFEPLLIAFAGLMGLCGVCLAAAGSHLGGGDLTRLAAEFLLMHAAVVSSLVALARSAAATQPLASRIFLASACGLGIATSLFSADLALAGLMNWHPIPLAAPIGGLGLCLGWIFVVAGAILMAIR